MANIESDPLYFEVLKWPYRTDWHEDTDHGVDVGRHRKNHDQPWQ